MQRKRIYEIITYQIFKDLEVPIVRQKEGDFPGPKNSKKMGAGKSRPDIEMSARK